MSFYTYLLECSDGTYYCGYTNDLDKRVENHNNGVSGAKYTRPRRPVKLVYFEEFDNKSSAMKREYEIKQMSRGNKKKLIADGLLKLINDRGRD